MKTEPTVDEMIKALQDIYKVVKDYDRESQRAILKAASRLIGNK